MKARKFDLQGFRFYLLGNGIVAIENLKYPEVPDALYSHGGAVSALALTYAIEHPDKVTDYEYDND
jgi:hypothetical protein